MPVMPSDHHRYVYINMLETRPRFHCCKYDGVFVVENEFSIE